MEIKSFKEIVLDYKLVLFDAYGVLKRHSGLIETTDSTLQYLLKNNIDFKILTNDASKSPAGLAEYYLSRGLDYITGDRIISSGLLAEQFLIENLQPKVNIAYIGDRKSSYYITNSGFNPIHISEANNHKIDLLLLLDDEDLTISDINCAINLLLLNDIPAIDANPDKIYPVTNNTVALTMGAVADIIESATGKEFIRFGKPYTSIFELAIDNVTTKNQILMVGDTLETDILGGNNFGIDTALVLTGNVTKESVNKQITNSGISPTFVCNHL